MDRLYVIAYLQDRKDVVFRRARGLVGVQVVGHSVAQGHHEVATSNAAPFFAKCDTILNRELVTAVTHDWYQVYLLSTSTNWPTYLHQQRILCVLVVFCMACPPDNSVSQFQ